MFGTKGKNHKDIQTIYTENSHHFKTMKLKNLTRLNTREKTDQKAEHNDRLTTDRQTGNYRFERVIQFYKTKSVQRWHAIVAKSL